MNQDEIDFWQEFASLVVQPTTPKIEYRLYYNEFGEITLGTNTVNDSMPTGDFLVVTEDEYTHYYQYKVVKGKLKVIAKDPGYVVQLEKATTGYTVVANHASLLLESSDEYNDVEYYDKRNH